jgi:uncharacterized protein (DUF885 family)
MSLKQSIKVSSFLVLVVLAAGCAKQPEAVQAPAAAPDTSAAWAAVPERFIEDYLKAQPFFAAQSGRHEFDGQMPDLSAAGIQAEIKRLHAARDAVAQVAPAGLKPSQQLEREVLLNVADRDLFWMEKAQWPFRNPAWYLDKLDPDVYLSREYAPLPQRMKAYIGYSRAVPAITAAMQANLRAPLPRPYVEYGIKAFGGFADFYRKDIPKIFDEVKDADLQKQLQEANAAAIKAMSELQAWFVAQRKTATDDFAIGPDLYAQMVKDTEMVDLPVEQIEAAGKADLKRNTESLTAACAQYLPNGTLLACIAKMSADKPKEDVVVAARAQLKDLKAFIQEHGIVTIPSNEEARVAQAPPYNAANFAFINVPGPYDHGVGSTYNISPPDPKWTKAEQAAYIPGKMTLLNTSVHEVWPGHFLQFLHSNANPSKAQSLWVGYAFAEGWAHYCEEMMADQGLAGGDPALRIAQIRDALLRDVRLLSSIGLHTHGMSVADSEKMFREQAFQDAGNARQQSTRGTYDPAYLNYTLGKLMIKKLRADWLAKKNLPAGSDEKAQWRAFHDQFLSYGGPPVPLVRREMLGDASGSLL